MWKIESQIWVIGREADYTNVLGDYPLSHHIVKSMVLQSEAYLQSYCLPVYSKT